MDRHKGRNEPSKYGICQRLSLAPRRKFSALPAPPLCAFRLQETARRRSEEVGRGRLGLVGLAAVAAEAVYACVDQQRHARQAVVSRHMKRCATTNSWPLAPSSSLVISRVPGLALAHERGVSLDPVGEVNPVDEHAPRYAREAPERKRVDLSVHKFPYTVDSGA